ncbi:major facilitator superfamily domain-containing protein [Aspergillus alliaceus]|uniref:Major facilitator superfamily domain-containing protein n=1 Tax=Petromyces alliaceus TaxID=209559 RepID=A0A5N7C4J7_PETAA|nr:major facilitator superfamily domain-containing protein [Aspergillus alliaceus]
MESLLQSRRIHQAVAQELAGCEKQCTCGGEHGTSNQHVALQLPSMPPPYSDVSSDETSCDSVIHVGWAGPDDKLNPVNWSVARKVFMTVLVSLIGVCVTAASTIDAAGVSQYIEEFNTSEVVGSLTTALFLIGFAFGSLVSAPFSETFGRNVVYISTMVLFLLFIMAAALAPNLPSHLVFRFIAGFFGSTPLSCAGGTVADLWDPVQKTYAFIIYAIPALGGAILGQMIGSFIPSTLGWRWLEWIILILGGAVLVAVALLQPETYGGLLLQWKASALRKQTGDSRYKAPMELRSETLQRRIVIAIYRPFAWPYSEPIIILISLYLTVIFIILFTFLEGYRFIFGETYGLSQGLTSMAWCGIFVGMVLVCLVVPVIYSWTRKEYAETARIRPETRLWYAMLGGGPAVPIGLFWMGWTAHPSISVWSPLAASVVFGYGVTTIFISANMYIIDTYNVYSASALGFTVFARYLVSGGVLVAGSTIYKRYGTHYTLTVLGAISAVMAVIPYLLYYYGPRLRKRSKHAVLKD